MKNKNIDRLIEILAQLRAPEGCPWDRKQTHKSLVESLYEEVAELADAIEDNDKDGICEELGDLLLHIVFHSQIANENSHFDFDKVAEVVSKKMINRHPHVFRGDKIDNAKDVITSWEKIKKEEKKGKRESILDGVPRNLSSLLKARKVQKKVAHYGFDWRSEQEVVNKIEEELLEVKEAIASGNQEHIDEEIGDLLFAVVNLSRFRKRDSAEQLLAKGVNKFIIRFQYIEKELEKANISLEDASIEEMEKLWNQAKKQSC